MPTYEELKEEFIADHARNCKVNINYVSIEYDISLIQAEAIELLASVVIMQLIQTPILALPFGKSMIQGMANGNVVLRTKLTNALMYCVKEEAAFAKDFSAKKAAAGFNT